MCEGGRPGNSWLGGEMEDCGIGDIFEVSRDMAVFRVGYRVMLSSALSLSAFWMVSFR